MRGSSRKKHSGDCKDPDAGSCGSLIEFYTETNKPDEVKKWQAEKDKPQTGEKK